MSDHPFFGYEHHVIFLRQGPRGALSDTSFEFGGNSYTVEALFEWGIGTAGDVSDSLGFDLDTFMPVDDRDELRLHLCAETFELAGAENQQLDADNFFAWRQSAPLDWSHAPWVLAALSTENVAPVFDETAPATRAVAENTAAGEAIGAPVTATDYETLHYTLEGTDAAAFAIDPDTGQIRTVAGVDYDHETKWLYSFTVRADDGKGESATLVTTLTVTDVEEPPEAPEAPVVESDGPMGVSVEWSAPANTGPDIEHYDLRYRVQNTSDWTDGPQDVTATSTTIEGLVEATVYEVQVRAANAEGDGAWSASGLGSTGGPASGAPGIEGTTQVGRTLTAGAGDIADPDGLPETTFPAGYTFQWVRVDGSTETDVGADAHTYTPVAADVDTTLLVEVTFTDREGNVETVRSDAVGPVVAAPEGCSARLHNDWCTTLMVKKNPLADGTAYGYALSEFGSLADPHIDHGADSKTVERVLVWDPNAGTDEVIVGFTSGRVRYGAQFNLGGAVLTTSATVEHDTHDTRYQWDRPASLRVWLDGQEVTVSANLPPSFEGATVNGPPWC